MLGFALVIYGIAFVIGALCAAEWGPASQESASMAASGAAIIAAGLLATISQHIGVGDVVIWLMHGKRSLVVPRVARWLRPLMTPAFPTEAPVQDWLRSEMEHARAANCNLDLRGYDFSGSNLGKLEGEATPVWSRLIFGLNDGEPTAKVTGVKFAKATLVECRFVNMELEEVDFTESEIVDCDFRFSSFRRVRLDGTFTRCDMFGASIEAGTIALGAVFKLSTLPVFGDGVTGLNWGCFAGNEGIPALAGEDARVYEAILRRSEDERRSGDPTVEDAVDGRLGAAASGYRRLSGYWSANGSFRESNMAYTRSRRLERRSWSPWFAFTRRYRKEGSFSQPGGPRKSIRAAFKSRLLKPLGWAGLWMADLVSLFGQSLTRVFATLVLVIFLPGLGYEIWGGVHGARGFGDDLLFSASHLTIFNPDGLTYATRVAEWFGVAQAALALGLVGLFGFVLGNVLRQS
jgi:hypothetical protein